MPLRSKSQQRFMFAAEARGELPKGTARRWAHETPNIKKLPEKVHTKKAFVEALEKAAAPAGNRALYKGLEYGGLGALAGLDLHSAVKAQREGKKEERNKALLGAGALGALMGATHLAG